MVQRLEITGVHFVVDEDVKNYVEEKLGKLDGYVSRHIRESLRVEVKLKASKAENKQAFTCEVIMHLPQDTFMLKETASTMFASIDIVEEKLKIHLKKYKDLHTNPKLRQRSIVRLKKGLLS